MDPLVLGLSLGFVAVVLIIGGVLLYCMRRRVKI